MTLLESLYCEENHQWLDDEDEEEPVDTYSCVDNNSNNNNYDIHPQHKLIPQDLCWEHQELSFLFSKESQQLHNNGRSGNHRRIAVEWILRVVSHYSFSAVTAVLAVNYLDRFLDKFEELDTEKKPWMTQLAAVACLSIAAKVEETHVPLLLDLQIDGSKYIFQAKTVKKMEILILSTLQWKMNPVTPFSFFDYIVRRLGLRSYYLSSDQFIKKCECLLLCFLPDGRFRCHLPSVIATATMVHVISRAEPCIGTEFQNQLLGILGINKEEVEECWKEIMEVTCSRSSGRHKRKSRSSVVPGSRDDVMGLLISSDESWSIVNPLVSEPGAKKSRNGAA